MRKTVMALAGLVVLAMASVGTAQTKPTAPAGAASHTQSEGQSSPQMPMMTPEMMAMMCSQMRYQMGMPGMGMGSGMMGGGMMGASDPKAQARMLRFRADMMKAMSDVMLKHATELEKAK